MAEPAAVTPSLDAFPLWLLVLVAAAGMAGEMRQLDLPGMTWGEIVRRVALRFGSSALFGMATLMLVMWRWQDVMLAGAAGILVGLIGADVVGALYIRWLEKKSGLSEVKRGE